MIVWKQVEKDMKKPLESLGSISKFYSFL